MENSALKDVRDRIGACALCLECKTLRKSHIIPNAVFRRIKQANNTGQIIQFDDADHSLICRSQDTWQEYLLCADCEQVISSYERYGLELLRSRARDSVNEHAAGITFRAHHYPRFKLFLTSLVWRASVSRQPIFAKAQLLVECEEAARESLLNGKAMASLRLGCRIHRLIDSTGTANGGFDLENLRQIVISPIPRWHDGHRYYTLLFLLEGFLLEFFVPGVPYKQANQRGVHRDSAILFAPNKCIFTVPEMVNLLISGHGKQDPDPLPSEKWPLKA